MLPTDAGGIRPRKLAAVGPAGVGAPAGTSAPWPAGRTNRALAGPPLGGPTRFVGPTGNNGTKRRSYYARPGGSAGVREKKARC